MLLLIVNSEIPQIIKYTLKIQKIEETMESEVLIKPLSLSTSNIISSFFELYIQANENKKYTAVSFLGMWKFKTEYKPKIENIIT